MATNDINIKLTSEQKIEKLKSGKPIYAESFLDTSDGKHLYEVTDKALEGFLKTQEVIRVSATEFGKLYETGFKNFEEQIKYLEDQRNKINNALKTATESEKRNLMENQRKVEESLKSVLDFQKASNKKSPIGTAVHKLLEMTIKKEIDLSNEDAAIAELNKRINLQKGSLPELSAIHNPKDKYQNSFRYAIRAANSLSSLMAEAKMTGGQAEKARTALIPSNGKIYMVSGTSDWDSAGRLGDYKTTSKFDPTHNIIQTVINAFLKRMESGDFNERIVGQVLHLPLTFWGAQRSSGSIYKINPGTYNEELKFIMDMINVMEGKVSREDVHLPGTYKSTARNVQEVTQRGKISGTQYAGKWMGSWLKEDPTVVEEMLSSLDAPSKERFIKSLFYSGDSGYYRTGGTADFLRNKYAKSYFSNSSLSQMQKSWEKDQYKDVIAKVIEEKAEQDPGIIYGLIYGNRDYGSISDDFYDWNRTSSRKTGRYLDIVSGLGSLGSGQAPTEEEKKWLGQGRSKYQKWQPDVFELAESKDLARLEQAEGEIKELPSQHEIEKATNELVSFLTYYPKILDLVRTYMEKNGISGDEEYEAKMIESFLAKRETEMGYRGGYEKFMSSKEVYDALITPKEERIKDLQEMIEEAKSRAEKNDTPENREAVVNLVRELESAQTNIRNVTLREIMGFLQEKASSLEEGEIPERERKTLNKLDYYKKIGYWSMINDIFDKRMSYFGQNGPQFTYSSDIQKLLEPSENIEDFVFEGQKKKSANKFSFIEDEQRQQKELEKRFKKHQEELDAMAPPADILTPEEFTVTEILDKIQNEYFGTKMGSTIIGDPQMKKIKNVLTKNILDQGESFGDFLLDIESGEKLSAPNLGWMRKLFLSKGFKNSEEEISNLYDEYSASALGARESEIDEEAMNRATIDIKKKIERISTLNQNLSGLEEFFQTEIQERTEKEKEFKEAGENWWYQIQPDIGGKPRWFKTSRDMSGYAEKTGESAGDTVSGSLGGKFYTGELIQTSRTRPWATYYEGSDPYADSFDVMQYDLISDVVQKTDDKKEEMAENISNVISDSIVAATDGMSADGTMSESVAEKVVENVENKDLRGKRSDAAKRGWATRRNKNNASNSTVANTSTNAPIQTPQDGPVHVIVDGTTGGDFTNKKRVAEMWDPDGRLISYMTKEINKRTSDKPRGTPQLDVIKQIKEDTGKIVDMMASQPPPEGGSNLPPINESPSGGGSSSGGDGNNEKKSQKALRSEYIRYLKEQYDLLIKIDALKHQQKQAEYRKDDVTGIKRDIGILEMAERDIASEMSSERFSGMSGDESIAKAEEVQKRRRQSKKNLLEMGDAEDALKSFEKYAQRRMKLEGEIYQAQLKANTSVGIEKKAWENVVALKKDDLAKTKERYDLLREQAAKYNKTRVSEIEADVAEESAINKAQKLASQRGNKSLIDVIRSDMQKVAMRVSDFSIVVKGLNQIRKTLGTVWNNIKDLNSAMTDLRIVVGANEKQASSAMVQYNDLAKEIGSTTTEVAKSGAEWLRQGYSMNETLDLIKSSVYLSKLGFMDMSSSISSLTSVMKGFNIEAKDSMEIVSVLTKLDQNLAVSAGGLAEAMSQTAAVAQSAGLTMEETASAVGVIIDKTQAGASQVGNALKTILARFGNVKAGAFVSLMGDESEIDDTNAAINDTEKVLGAIGIKVRSSSSDMRDFNDVMDELAEKWETLTDVERNAVATALGGTRQRNFLQTWLSNYAEYKKSLEDAESASGSAEAKYEAQMESLAFQFERISTAWEEFTQKLEANGAVIKVFEKIYELVSNVSMVMQGLSSLIVGILSFKIPAIVTKIVDFFASSTGAGRMLFDSDARERAQKEELRKVREKESGDALVDSNTRLTKATEHLADVMEKKRAQDSKDSAFSTPQAASGTGVRGVAQGIIDGKRTYQTKDGTWKYYNNKNVADSDVGRIAQQQQPQPEPQKKNPRSIMRFTRADAIRVSATGAVAGLFAGLTKEGDTMDKVTSAVTTGATTALISAIPVVGTILGPIVGPWLGDLLSSKILLPLLKADEYSRKERVKQAKDNLEAIKGISTSVTGLIDLRKKGDTSLWDSDDWKQAGEYVESITSARDANEDFKDAMDKAVDGVEGFSWTIEGLTKNQETLAKIEAARIKYEAEQTYAAGEQDRYDLLKKIEEAQKTLSKSTDEEEKKKAEASITANKAAIREYADELNKAYMKSAFYSSGISNMSQAQKNTASLDRLVLEWAIAAQEAAKDTTGEKWLDDQGRVKDESRSTIIQQIREAGGYEAVLTSSEKSVRDYKNANLIAANYVKELEKNEGFAGLTVDKLKELANTADGIEKLKSALGKEEATRVIDAINDVDETKIATIAHSLNMTVEEFEKANKNGDFDFFTTGMALENLDAFIERIDKLGDSFAELAVKGKLSGDALNNVIKNYAFLLEGKGSFSTENIVDNLVDLYVGGNDSTIAQAIAGKFQREASTREDWWDAWKNSSVAAGFKETTGKEWKSTTFKTFKEAVNKMSEEEQKSYSEFVASMFNADMLDAINDKIIEYKTNAYDQEIANLQSIKDAIGDVNKQREKELELIKAKEALENASKEKVRVYREGMGFVYTTNQEAVKSAQEKVDELEKQQTQDDLQYQIDILNQQKSILQNIEKNEELKSLTEVVEKIRHALGDKSIFSQIVNGKEGQGSLTETIAEGIILSTQKTKEEENKNAANTAAMELEKAKGDLDQFVNKNQSILNDPNNPAYNSTYAKYEEKWKNFEDKRGAFNEAAKAEGVNAGGDENNIKNWENIKGYSDYIKKLKERDGNTNYSISYWTKNGSLLSEQKIKSSFDTSLPTVSEDDDAFKKHMVGGNRSDKDRYLIARYNQNTKKWDFYKTESNFSDLRQSLLPYDVVINDWNASLWGDRAIFVSDDGSLRWINKDEGGIVNKGRNQFNYTYQNAKPLPSSEIDASSNEERYEHGNRVSYQYDSGTFSSTGGTSLINENGLESIITPQGTITSLPAKSGIIPADLTRNLWALGEVAPNLIARLGGSNLQTNNNVATNDNSINVDTLNATFNTTKDFDTQKFWMAVKNETILTKNNH